MVTLHPALDGPPQPGALVGGTVEFAQHAQRVQQAGGGGATLRCMEVAVALETEECVHQRWQAPGKGPAALRHIYEEQASLRGAAAAGPSESAAARAAVVPCLYCRADGSAAWLAACQQCAGSQ